MNRQIRKITHFVYIGLMVCISLEAQENKPGEESLKGAHQLTMMISHSHISQGISKDGNKEWLVVPSWGFDYSYWIAERWAVGIQTDIILESFKVEEHGSNAGGSLERTRPFAVVPAVAFKPQKHSVFILGMGGEFAKEGSFALTRFNYEYSWELPNNWELSPSISYDIKWNAYDTWTIGVAVSKILKKKHQ